MQENLHDGHRERLINKFIEFPDSFSDHELLEIFLFTVMPRKDTNALAHRLVQAFGNVGKVFSATAEQLMTVNGVGKAIAAQIVLHGKLMKKIAATTPDDGKAFTSLDRIKSEIVSLFRGTRTEKFYAFLLGDAFETLFRLEYTGNNESAVFANVAEIARAISLHKPKYAIIAHNHPSGNANPSPQDDKATAKFCIACDLHGVSLVDHIIVAGEKVYSYFVEKRLDFIKERVKKDVI